MARIVQSVLVGIGAAVVALVLLLVCMQIYVSYFVHHSPGIGAIAGGIALSLPIAVLVFFAGFGWNWWLTNPGAQKRGTRGTQLE